MAIAAFGATTQDEKTIIVGMGELRVSGSPDAILSCIGLGSCIAVFAYDRLVKVGGLVHIVLPRYDGADGNGNIKYANIAVPHLLAEVEKQGAIRSRLTVKIAGGAQMTQAPGLRDTFRTGERNLAEVMAALLKEKVPMAAADTGGTAGRTVKMYLATGKVMVKTVGGVAREL